MKTATLQMACLIGLMAAPVHFSSCTVEEEAPAKQDVVDDATTPLPSVAVIDRGLSVDGQPIMLGDSATAISDLLKTAESVRTMGNAGTVHSYPSLHLDVWMTDKDGTQVVTQFHLFAEADATTADGIGTDSEEADLVDKLGEGIPDPFSLGRHYPDLGLFFGMTDGKVDRLTVFEAIR